MGSVIESIALKPLIMSSSYTEFGFEINNRRFAVKIPKLKIRTPKMLMKRKGRKTPAVKPQEHDLRLKELNTRYNAFLTVKRENNRFGSEASETSGSSTSSVEVEMPMKCQIIMIMQMMKPLLTVIITKIFS